MEGAKYKVIQILSQGGLGGAERSVQWFAEELDRSLFDYYFLFLYNGGPIRDSIAALGFPTIVLNWANGYSIIGRLNLMYNILKINPHLIHDHAMTPLSRICMKMVTRAPIISSQHGNFYRKINDIQVKILRWDDFFTALVIANSNFTAGKHSIFYRRPISKIKTIHLGINPDNYLYHINIINPVIEQNKRIKILFIGRLEEYKGAGHIPLLARSLVDHGENFIINVAGSGTMMEKCLKLSCELNVSENINYLGWKSNVIDLLHDTDILVSLSLIDEAFGLVFLEALAAGVPVFAYSGGGIIEILANAPYGWLIPKGDFEGMAISIIKNKPVYINCDKLAGYDYVKNNFNIQKTTKEIEGVYKDYLR